MASPSPVPSHRHPALVIKHKTSTTVNHLVNTVNANIYNISILNIPHSLMIHVKCKSLLLAMAKNLPENGVSWQERSVLGIGIGLELLQQISIHKFVVWTIWT